MFILMEIYTKFQVPLFLSSITIGTFLFSMKTFIIQTIKKEVYDSKSYRDTLDIDNAHQDSDNKTDYYRGLRNLSRLIFWTITLALTSALLQITIGNICALWAVIICLFSTAVSWLLLFFSLILVSSNMNDMLTHTETLSSNDEKKVKSSN